MSMKWPAMFMFVWIIGIILGSTYDGYGSGGPGVADWALGSTAAGTGGYATSPVNVLTYLIKAVSAGQILELLGAIKFVVMNPDFWFGMFKMITWQFSFWMGDYVIFYVIFGLPFVLLGVGSAFLFVMNAIRGNVTWG